MLSLEYTNYIFNVWLVLKLLFIIVRIQSQSNYDSNSLGYCIFVNYLNYEHAAVYKINI